VWATDLSVEATCLDDRSAFLPMPPKVAIVIGRESDGVSPELLAACDRRLFIPMYGFTESFNLSVACGLMLQRLFDVCPEARGDLSEQEKASLRAEWFRELANNPTAR
jgi:tRNA G18 (ribose-2'-O)-methylase SpoU